MRLLLLLACLAVGVLAAPKVKDIETTSVDITVPTPDHSDAPVTVTVQRIDELIDDQTGDLLAARIVDVAFSFDVDPHTAQPMVNNVPVALGLTQVKVETVLAANKAIAAVLPPELIAMAFDIGLAVVDVSATEEQKWMVREELVGDVHSVAPPDYRMPDIFDVRRITVRVKVTEINGVKVEQINIVEQVMDVLAEGWIIRGTPRNFPFSDDPSVMAAMEARREAHMRHCSMMRNRVGALWARLPRATRVAVAAFFGSLLLLVFFVALPLAAYVHWKERRDGYQVVETHDIVMRMPTIPEEDDEVGDTTTREPHPTAADEKAWLRANDEQT